MMMSQAIVLAVDSRAYSKFHNRVAQFLAGLEERNSLGGYLDSRAGFGIPSDSSLSLSRPESAEAADLDFVTTLDRLHHAVEDAFYDDASLFLRQLRDPGHLGNQICFCQNCRVNAGVRRPAIPVYDHGSDANRSSAVVNPPRLACLPSSESGAVLQSCPMHFGTQRHRYAKVTELPAIPRGRG